MDRSVLYCLAKKPNESEHNSHIKGEPFATANFVKSRYTHRHRHTKYSQVFFSRYFMKAPQVAYHDAEYTCWNTTVAQYLLFHISMHQWENMNVHKYKYVCL